MRDAPDAIRACAWRLFFTCWLVYALHFATNTVRELFPAMSLGDRLSFDISEYEGLHPDIFRLEGRGVFINNNPGGSMVGALPYAACRPIIDRIVTTVRERRAAGGAEPPKYDSPWPMAREFYRKSFELGLDVKFGLAAAATQALGMAPLSAACVVAMFHALRARIGSPRPALWLAVLYAFATPVFFRTGQLNHNLVETHAAMLAFLLLWRPWDAPESPRRPAYLAAGLLTGFTVVCDYSGLVAVLVLSTYGLSRWLATPSASRRTSDPAWFALGVCLSGALLAGYQWACFGNPWLPAQHYMPAGNENAYRGYSGMDWPALDLIGLTLASPRYGLFVTAPILVLALWPAGWRAARGAVVGHREAWCIGAMTLLFVLFCAANQFTRLQFNSGLRHVLPVAPFLFLIAAGTLRQMPRSVAIAIGIASVYWSWCLAQYREVELGRGVLDSVIVISTQGPRLPWLTTLGRMSGMFPPWVTNANLATPLLLAAALLILLIWRVGHRRAALGDNCFAWRS
ncbi:MAG: hypothetical protein U1D55_12730 [Phycisphaerae bacterium]